MRPWLGPPGPHPTPPLYTWGSADVRPPTPVVGTSFLVAPRLGPREPRRPAHRCPVSASWSLRARPPWAARNRSYRTRDSPRLVRRRKEPKDPRRPEPRAPLPRPKRRREPESGGYRPFWPTLGPAPGPSVVSDKHQAGVCRPKASGCHCSPRRPGRLSRPGTVGSRTTGRWWDR